MYLAVEDADFLEFHPSESLAHVELKWSSISPHLSSFHFRMTVLHII